MDTLIVSVAILLATAYLGKRWFFSKPKVCGSCEKQPCHVHTRRSEELVQIGPSKGP